MRIALALTLSLVAASACKKSGEEGLDAGAPGLDAAADPSADAAQDAAGEPDLDAATSDACTDDELAALEAEMADALDAAAVDTSVTELPDFTLLLETEDGRRFTHSHGDSTADTRYESASTSKWVTAVVILGLVDQGLLTLDTTAHELIAFWDEPDVDLRDLLSFTSGFDDEPPCLDRADAGFAACVQNIYEASEATAAAPGTEYAYGSTHLQVAGLMAVRAAGVAGWSAVFDEFRTRTGLFPAGVYDLPSESNPRLASGMTWTGEEYLGFLRALYAGELLEPETAEQLHADQRGTAAVIDSPIIDAIGEDWSYGLGNWLECPTATGGAGSFDCGAGHRNSSAGAFGAYPFIDFDDHYFGLVARQGSLRSAREGIAIFRSVEALASRWSTRTCDGSPSE